MSDATDLVEPLLRLKPGTVRGLLLLLAVLVGVLANWFRVKFSWEDETPLVDFDVFHMVGRMHWMGRLEDAYVFRIFLEQQEALTGGQSFMPWTYPPPFDLVAAGLGLLPVWVAYLLFVGTTLAAYLAVLRRLAGGQFPAVLVALLPVFVVSIICGQNGFLTGTLIGLFALGALRGSGRAGVPLGLMVVKPHLALGLGLFLVMSRRWGWIAQSAAVAAGTAGLATLAFGLGIWPAFLHGVEESGGFLEQGRYPLQRMTSAYAGLRSFGVDSRVAFGVHAGVALCALAAVQWAVLRGWRTERVLAAAVLATLTVSPYNYDYDMPILGIALALAARTVADAGSRRLFGLALGLAGVVGAYPILVTKLARVEALQPWITMDGRPYSLAPFALAALVGLLLAMMARAERAGAAGAARPALS